MGLLYNHKSKRDVVVLSEEQLENPEAEPFGFVILSEDDEVPQPASESGKQEGGNK